MQMKKRKNPDHAKESVRNTDTETILMRRPTHLHIPLNGDRLVEKVPVRDGPADMAN